MFTFLKSTVQQHWIYSYCCAAAATIRLQNSSSSQTETLHPSDKNSLFLPPIPQSFCVYEFDLISPLVTILFHLVWCPRGSFRLNNVSWCVFPTVCLFFCPSMAICFHLLAISSKAVMNTGVQMWKGDSVLRGACYISMGNGDDNLWPWVDEKEEDAL